MPNTPTPDQVRELQALEQQATGAPWEAREFAHEETPWRKRRVYRVEIVMPVIHYGKRLASRLICQMVDFCDWTDHPANRDFIIKSRNLAPGLLTSWLRMEAENKRLRGVVEIMLASAHPHPVEHPTMTAAWKVARAALAGEAQEVKE